MANESSSLLRTKVINRLMVNWSFWRFGFKEDNENKGIEGGKYILFFTVRKSFVARIH